MPAVIEAPLDLVEAVAELHFPPKTDQLLQSLMDRNNGWACPACNLHKADRISASDPETHPLDNRSRCVISAHFGRAAGPCPDSV
jgi:hypothetical protein